MTYRSALSSVFAMVLTVALLFVPNAKSRRQRDSHVPKSGFVPDALTAVRIAEAVIAPIYGDEVIQKEKPLVAEPNERGDVWIVHGHPPSGAGNAGWRGGVVVVEISKATGCILRVNHPK
jgi:hypothetical protein